MKQIFDTLYSALTKIKFRVLNVEPLSKRIEVTLKTVNAGGQQKSESYDLKKFHVGDIISGRIKRVEPYGLFISIDQTSLVKI